MKENDIAAQIVDAALKIHKELGPGLLESVYEVVLAYELRKRGLGVERQVAVPIQYEEIRIEEGFRIDLLVQDLVIVELKSVESLQPVHAKTLLTYLRLTKKHLGLLINFNVLHLKDGIQRLVNQLEEPYRAITKCNRRVRRDSTDD